MFRAQKFGTTLVVPLSIAFAGVINASALYAAVPVEESVEDFRREGAQQAPQQQANQRITPRTAERPPSLDIPPTIEPTVNTDYSDSAVTSGTPLFREQTQEPTTIQPNQAVSGGQLSQLFYQLQVLQQEIQELRGQLEEQTYLVNRLQRDQKEQYLDLDRRVMALSENRPAPGPVSTPTESVTVPSAGGSRSERQVYTQAFEAMKARQFDESMASFQNLIETYPNGQYTPNAYYWLGELYLVAKTDAELARQSFMQVVSLYPDHQKAPDALYKLGVVYHNLGDVPSAQKFLQRVQQEHPNSAAAGLAAKYAAEL